MKRIGLTMALVSLLALAGQAFAVQCAIEVTPAATLLLPYFEVCPNPANPNDPSYCPINTYFRVKNASDVATVVHVVLWTDFSIPTLDFNIFLTGYDVQSVNLCQLFATGGLPATADVAGDPFDTISPHDFMPAWDATMPGCAGHMPPGFLGPIHLDRIRAGHSGLMTLYDGAYLGYDYGIGATGTRCYRGYITMDNVYECNLYFPGDTGYFADGGDPLGTVSNVNQLWGDWALVDYVNNYAQGEMLVHIEAFDCVAGVPDTPACVGVTEAWTDGDYTFWGRFVSATAIDNREPLFSIWATDYMMANPVFPAGTDLFVWRDAKDPDIVPVPFGGAPTWFQLNQTQIVAFDEEENWAELCVTTGNVSPPLGILTCFPLETQRITLGPTPGGPGSPVNPPYQFGWLFLNLNHTNAATGLFGDIAQNWVVTVMNAHGTYSIGYDVLALESSCTPSYNYILP